MRGAFITFEGVEGVGKSTLIEFAAAHLESTGRIVLRTREPGGTPLAEAIRSLLIGECREGMHADTELLLMFAARNQHLETRIRPALDENRWVLSDRFNDASYAYQGGGRGIDMERIRFLECFVQRGLQPDLTFLLDAPLEIGMRRAAMRQRKADRFESEAMFFFERVRNVYLERASLEPQRFRLIDASQSLEAVQAEVRKKLDEFIAYWEELK